MKRLSIFLVCVFIICGCTKEAKIGNQVWMAENLDVDHYRNGDPIPEVKDTEKWQNLKTGAWCYYDNNPENGKKYGRLYNWYAVKDQRGLAPDGWHIPTVAEFEILRKAVGENGNSLKAIGQGRGSGAGTNKSGFSALLAGGRTANSYFYEVGDFAYFWSSDGDYLYLYYNDHDIASFSFDEYEGFSVRCLKD